MYVRMLEDTVRELRGEEVAPEIHSSLNLGLDLRIPSSYIRGRDQRLRAYKRIAQAVDLAEREKWSRNSPTATGRRPDEVRHLLTYSGSRPRRKGSASKPSIGAFGAKWKFHGETAVEEKS